MTERAELMRIYRSNGISSISLMRDHYNKHDNGGDIQPSDATFRATLTNPVNSYRSNAPAGIGDAAITKATGIRLIQKIYLLPLMTIGIMLQNILIIILA